MIKKLTKIIFSLIIFLNINVINASSANVSIGLSKTSLVVGDNLTVTVNISSNESLGAWQYNLNYDSSKLTLISGSPVKIADVAKNNTTKNVKFTYNFKAKSRGNANISLSGTKVLAFNEMTLSANNPSRSVVIMTREEYEATLSKNNNLSSLSIEGYELQEPFDKDTLEYNVDVPNDIRNINVVAQKEDNTALVEGTGSKELEEGLNALEIKVTAQNGSVKTYILNVTVKELDPINVTVNGKNYTVVRKRENLIKLEHFEETTIQIDDKDVPSLYNKYLNYNLVGLKDENNEVKLYRFKDNEYVLYNYIKTDSFNFVFQKFEKKLKYNETTIKINNQDIVAYEMAKNSNYKIVYGTDIATNKTGLYLYDTNTKNIISFDENIFKDDKIIINFFMGTTAFMILLWIFTLTIKRKNKTRKFVDEVNIKQPEIKNLKSIDNEKSKPKETKKQKKELKKLNKQKLKEEAKFKKKKKKELKKIILETNLESKVSKSELKKKKKELKKQQKDFLS